MLWHLQGIVFSAEGLKKKKKEDISLAFKQPRL